MVVAMRTATARLLRWGSKSNAPRVWVRGHGLCVQLRAVKQAVKFGNLEKWKFWTRFWNAKKWHMHTSTCLKHLASLDLFDLFEKTSTVQKNCCYHWQAKLFFPSLLIKIESTTNWLHHMAFSEGSQPEISNKIIARTDHLDAWKAKASSTVQAVAGSHFLLSKPCSLNRSGLHRFPHHFEKRHIRRLRFDISRQDTRHAVTIMWEIIMSYECVGCCVKLKLLNIQICI